MSAGIVAKYFCIIPFSLGCVQDSNSKSTPTERTYLLAKVQFKGAANTWMCEEKGEMCAQKNCHEVGEHEGSFYKKKKEKEQKLQCYK